MKYPDLYACVDADDYHERIIFAALVEEELDRLRTLVRGLFGMTTPEQWRETGGDDGQGHYEGDYRAAQLADEIRSWDESGHSRPLRATGDAPSSASREGRDDA